MRLRRLLLPAIFCLAANSAAAAHNPFVPPGVTPPDYAMTVRKFHELKIWKPDEHDTLITHHGDWTRVGSSYYLGRRQVSVEDFGSAVSFRRGEYRLSYTDYEPRNTREQQIHLGEICTIWDIERRLLSERGPVSYSSLSCVTDDGIELWQRTVDAKGNVWSSREAIHIERRPVADSEVAPRRDLLPEWDTDALTVTEQNVPDYETRMEPPKGRSASRITRRHGPWQFVDQIVGVRRRIEIKYGSSTLRLNYQSDDAGAPREIYINRALPKPIDTASSSEAAKKFRPQALDKSEIVLGESCRWFNMKPGVSDVSELACLTSDGITLKAVSSWGTSENWIAVSLTRRPVTIDEIKPPAELLMPQTWGIP
ncbi:hypothetical protein ABIF62_006504 [Bradyrhizobium japonicum]